MKFLLSNREGALSVALSVSQLRSHPLDTHHIRSQRQSNHDWRSTPSSWSITNQPGMINMFSLRWLDLHIHTMWQTLNTLDLRVNRIDGEGGNILSVWHQSKSVRLYPCALIALIRSFDWTEWTYGGDDAVPVTWSSWKRTRILSYCVMFSGDWISSNKISEALSKTWVLGWGASMPKNNHNRF